MYRKLFKSFKLVLVSTFVLLFQFQNLKAQDVDNIFELMERKDLKLYEIEKLADDYFNKVGTGQGTGHKHYQRWLYEQKFHLNEDQTFRDVNQEFLAYEKMLPTLRDNKNKKRAVWTDLGPITQNVTSSWNPGHGRCWTVAINPTNTNIIYAGTDGGGIWKTTNGGTSWVPLLDYVNSTWQAFYHIAIDPSNTAIVYAGLKSGGVIKSTNSGSNWVATGSGPTSIKRIRVHPTNSNIVFATGSNGIYRSTDAGTTWTQVKTGSTEDIQFNTANSNIMYASTSGTQTFWRSTDNGVTWTNITAGITNSGRSLIGVSPNNSNTIYIVQASGSLFGRLYKSTDGGLNFTTTVIGSAGSGTNYFGYETNGTGTTGQATHDMAIAVNPTNANEVHIAGIICWKSTNGGTSFTATTGWTWGNAFGYNHADVHSLVYQGATLYSSSDGGIWKSVNNAGDWSDISSNMGTRQFYRIACAKTNANVISGGAQDNGSAYRTSAGVWNEWLGADGMDAAISPTNSSIGIGTSQYGSIYRTTNAGTSRTNLTAPASGNWVTPLAWHPTNGSIVFGGWNDVYRSSDQGSTWTNISGANITGNITCLTIAPSNANYIYATIGSTIYRTADGGTTWTSSTAAGSTISSICVSPVNPSKIWVTTTASSNNVKVSTDNGTTFTDISAGLPAVAARSIAVDVLTYEHIYVGMNIGVYSRNSFNNVWVEHATGLPLVAVNEVEIQKSGNKLRVATYGRGVWESPLNFDPAREQINLNDYCNTTKKSDKEWIDYVEFSNLKHASGNNNGYLQHKNDIATTAINSTYALKVKAGFANHKVNEKWAVYIDYNHDGDFNDEEECVTKFVSSIDELTTSNISIPTTAKIGYTTMRVIMQFNGFSTPCDEEGEGEVEDYIIHIGSTKNGFEIATENVLHSENKSELVVYPNPTKELAVLEYNNNSNSATAIISIQNINGSIVRKIPAHLSAGNNSFRIDISDLQEGQYTISINTNNNVQSKKLVVIK